MRSAILAATMAAMMVSTAAIAQSSNAGSQHGQFYRTPAEQRGQEVQGSQFYRTPAERRGQEVQGSQFYRHSSHHHKKKIHVHAS
jgi:hypothetical protein